jgi:hypothetical protein
MKTFFRFGVGVLMLVVLSLDAADVGWAERNRRIEEGKEPESSAWGFLHSTNTAVDRYSEWSEAWKKSDRRITDGDLTINHLMEGYIFGVAKYLSKNDDPKLLEYYLRFVGQQVPEDFNEVWNVVFLELPDADPELARLVDVSLEEDGYTPLSKRLNARK